MRKMKATEAYRQDVRDCLGSRDDAGEGMSVDVSDRLIDLVYDELDMAVTDQPKPDLTADCIHATITGKSSQWWDRFNIHQRL
ncbi:hypothetical protein [Rhodococcus opacus]|uniref:hypothetical protein n=1 Tax=Rhodococcus opacus TaxID=37919 RepID=UPI0024764B5C|nr:hypothetical protein [Rhodococcus opacus]MDH6291363.1 hypothetical protein [Rhodococcus opacus]